jgi:predicted transcriptional regulator
MNVTLPQELEAKLNHMATESGRAADDLVRELVESYVAHDDWFRSAVREGLTQIESGKLLDHEEVGARMEALIQKKQSR